MNDNPQNDYGSPGDWGNELEVDNSDDDSKHDPNDIGEPVDAVTLSRSHNMSTQSRLGNMVCDLPSVKNDTGLDRPHWRASQTCPMLSIMVVAEQAGV